MGSRCSEKFMAEGWVLTRPIRDQTSGDHKKTIPRRKVLRPVQFSARGRDNTHHIIELECLCIPCQFFFPFRPKEFFFLIFSLMHIFNWTGKLLHHKCTEQSWKECTLQTINIDIKPLHHAFRCSQ